MLRCRGGCKRIYAVVGTVIRWFEQHSMVSDSKLEMPSKVSMYGMRLGAEMPLLSMKYEYEPLLWSNAPWVQLAFGLTEEGGGIHISRSRFVFPFPVSAPARDPYVFLDRYSRVQSTITERNKVEFMYCPCSEMSFCRGDPCHEPVL